jgi:AcrR family transcriptional regulator
MPKETFFNLPELKRRAILDVIQTVFLEKPTAKISVSDIVKGANIPRGSFYMYFEDLEDMFDYLLDYSMEAYEQEELKRIEKENMTFFDYMEQALLKDIEFFSKYQHQQIVSKFMSNIHVNNFDYTRYLRRRHTFFTHFFNQIDKGELEGLQPERIMYLYNFIIQFKMQMIQTVFKRRLSIEQVNEEYQWFIKVIRKGLIEEK